MNRFFRWFGLPGTVVLTGLMSLTALVMALIFRTPDRWLRFSAMLLGSLGDLILMNDPAVSKRLPPFLRSFIAGGSVFLLSHVVYALAFGTLIRQSGAPLVNAGFWIGLGLGLAAIGSLFVLNRLRGKRDPLMMALCCVYMLAIGTVLVLVCSYAVSRGGAAWFLAAGSVSFIVSDYFIALNTLTTLANATTEGLIWWFYPIGQLLLVVPVI